MEQIMEEYGIAVVLLTVGTSVILGFFALFQAM